MDALGDSWDVSLLAGPRLGLGVPRTRFIRWAVAGLTDRLAGPVLLDLYEPWSWRRFRRWKPDADLGLLIGWPYSPLFAAGRRLARRGIPYVVDVGDPFALTPGATRGVSGIAARRAKRREAELWRGTTAGIATTHTQAAALRERFPALPILVRPNGHRAEDLPADAFAPRPRTSGPELRLAYFGNFWQRIHAECRWFFDALLGAGRWQSIVLDQYSPDALTELSGSLPEAIRFRRHPALPWDEAIRVAGTYDLAIAIGVRNGVQLPSKVVDYLTLPVPRVVVVESVEDDAISSYLAGKRGWLIVDRSVSELPERVAQHASTERTAEELAPPPEESWPRVTETIASFLGAVADGVAGGRR
jgi:hypothetical protein